MQRLPFDELFGMLSAMVSEAALTGTDIARLRNCIGNIAGVACIADPAECLSLIEQAAQGRPCPHCHCPHKQRCGSANGLQRFRCRDCRRTHNALTGTPLARLRKREHWLGFLQCVLDSRTVRDSARITGVHRTTSFRWRHRFVAAAARDRPAGLCGIVEVDETYRLGSQKGARKLNRPARRRGAVASQRGINDEHDCLLVARDRSGATLDFHTGRGPVSVEQLHACLGLALAADALLISDAANAYRCFAREAHITHEAANVAVNVAAGARVRGAIHIHNVSAWHSRFNSWLVRFRGVASRYLANYSGWQRLLDEQRLCTPLQWLRAAIQLN
jgi:transposase-like protein